MVWFVAMDQEALELLDAAAEMAAAALAARSRRVDEDGVLKRSSDMSRIKLETLRAGMHQAPLVRWTELEEGQRLEFLALVSNFLTLEGDAEREALWNVLRAFVLRPGPREPFSGGEKPWKASDLQQPRLACLAEPVAPGAASVQRVPRKRGKGNPSSGASG